MHLQESMVDDIFHEEIKLCICKNKWCLTYSMKIIKSCICTDMVYDIFHEEN